MLYKRLVNHHARDSVHAQPLRKNTYWPGICSMYAKIKIQRPVFITWSEQIFRHILCSTWAKGI